MTKTTYRRGDSGTMVKTIQQALARAGWKLMADGRYGQLTEEAVREFQRTNHLKQDGIVGLSTGLRLIGAMFLPRSRRIITELIVHCTATPEGRDYTVNDIRTWHRQQGWSDIGYHYVIYRDGTINPGRDVDTIGAHTAGHNTNSIGICYVGGCATDGKTPKDTRTPEQRQALTALLKMLREIYPSARIYGHRDFTNMKACPSFDARKEYRSL